MNKNGFEPSIRIENPKNLIGRNNPGRELSEITEYLTIDNMSVELIGQKRVGKTSLLLCAKSIIDSGEHGSNYITVYINSDKYDVYANDKNGYLFLLSELLAEYLVSEIYDDSYYIYEKLKIQKGKSAGDIIHLLVNEQIPYDRIFEKLVYHITNSSFSVILLIDEYEYLLSNSFHKVTKPFGLIRELATQDLNGQRLRVCISGNRTWQNLTARNVKGSPELNFIVPTVYIKPLEEVEIKRIIDDGIASCNGINKDNIQKFDDLNKVFELSGGHPFKALIICNEIARTGELNIKKCLHRLNPVLSDWWNTFSDEEREVILRRGEGDIDNLIDQGLLKEDFQVPGYYNPIGLLFNNFINRKIIGLQNIELIKVSNNKEEKPLERRLKVIAQKTTDLHAEIMELDQYLKPRDYTFNLDCSPNAALLLANISSPVSTKNEFAVFIDKMYFIIFETTKGKVYYTNQDGLIVNMKHGNRDEIKNCGTLPKRFHFYKYNEKYKKLEYPKHDDPTNSCPIIIYHINEIRNHYRHLGNNLRSPIREKILIKDITPIYIDKKIPPKSEHDFLQFQLNILNEYNITFLSEVVQRLKEKLGDS